MCFIAQSARRGSTELLPSEEQAQCIRQCSATLISLHLAHPTTAWSDLAARASPLSLLFIQSSCTDRHQKQNHPLEVVRTTKTGGDACLCLFQPSLRPRTSQILKPESSVAKHCFNFLLLFQTYYLFSKIEGKPEN